MSDTSEILKRGKVYPLGDALNDRERGFFGIPKNPYGIPENRVLGHKIMGIWDGKPRRPPKKGEWYLSGAAINAYRAPNDLTTEFHIAKLCRVEAVTYQKIGLTMEVGE
jgi:hypothetical protein